MYHRAQIYDLLYEWKNYKSEAEVIQQLLAKNNISDKSSLLEAGCGTCSHMIHFSHMFDYVCGFDLYKEMIQFAESKLSAVQNSKLFQADMIDLDTSKVLAKYNEGKPFDVIVSLFGCMGYIIGRSKLESVFRNFYNLTREGGVIIVENFLTPDEFTPYFATVHTYDGEDLKIARVSKSNFKFPHPQNEDEQNQIELHFNFMVATHLDPGGVDHFVDVHHMQLYSADFVKILCEKIGFVDFEVLTLEGFRSLYIMKKPSN
jgi:precorrin-6B methylase 2